MSNQVGIAGVVTGSYRVGVTTGLTAGLSANDPVFSFRWGHATQRCVIQKLRLSAQVITPFTAAQEVGANLIIARGFSASDSGGTALTLTTTNARLTPNSITSLVTDARVATTGALTSGTRTLDSQPMMQVVGAQTLAAAAAAFTPVPSIYDHATDVFGLQLDTNEGLIVRSTIALGAGGTVRFAIELEWAEFITSSS